MSDGFSDLGLFYIIGTRANPVYLDRGGALDDRAWWATIEELTACRVKRSWWARLMARAGSGPTTEGNE